MHIPNPHLRPPRIHWRRYMERKVIILAVLVAATYIAEHHFGMHQSLVERVHEFSISVLAEHLVFGIPLEG